MTKRVLVPIANGFEEIEALSVVDILRRAGAAVVLAGVGEERLIVGRSSIAVQPDQSLDEALDGPPYDMIVLPGGLPNAITLAADTRIISALRNQLVRGAHVAAICAAPLALKAAGALENRLVTSHPGIKAELGAARYSDARVVNDDRVLTSRGPGTALEFAFAIVRELYGDDKVTEVNAGVLARL